MKSDCWRNMARLRDDSTTATQAVTHAYVAYYCIDQNGQEVFLQHTCGNAWCCNPYHLVTL